MTLPKKNNPLSEQITIRFTKADYDALTSIPQYREKLRALIVEWLNSQEKEKEE
ncbi:hypothetical protein DSM106972_025630 [Dulcicalothrix desertica PCC 7102]|uniref:Uncharacterized protein n=1 Tax=Dulcicalothrix desertica PCC 7102 TaxID=232991 RepID=A0A3S1J466_9CYAN|nr:hypothetical protein [Dulcicalothrix desertica]RUT07302.1 hypothetical protein DSM106972_025630 [Dulcicalothrix desertica PCC 7102]TWH55501.1 hypothetical protein CAL7102_03645 [Dulcicalothrix desertica PCC 7102]